MKRPLLSSRSAAILGIAATYFFFLLFAEFAFLELASAVAPTPGLMRLVMAGLGAGGIAGAAGAAKIFSRLKPGSLLAWAFRGCAASGLIAIIAPNLSVIVVAGVLSGVSLGTATVTLAAMLRGAIGDSRLGLCLGAGTGLAYALCNLPWIFHAPPAGQAILAAVVAGAASLLSPFFETSVNASTAPRAGEWREVMRWIAILLALVWLDSAAFYIVQHTPALRATTWSQTRTLFANAGIHLLAALLAGVWLDRGRRALVAGVALAALAIAGLSLNGTLPFPLAANWFYTAGVSLYSVALVEFPARSGRPWIAALVFAVAGWGGSAFGIGMAQDLGQIPVGFIAAAALTVALALPWRTHFAARAAVVLVAMIGMVRADDVALGREVYITEGCIHCHSQYIRPRVPAEVVNWGPATSLHGALDAAPPLFGTRRQGPDLSHVGNRRSIEWNRLHLIAPQAISPGSRMPSYAYLFARGETRGDALVAYLASLGVETIAQRQQQVMAWKPDARTVVASGRAARLFARSCAQCHGQTGRGDGRLAAQLSVPPPDWSRMPWRHVGAGDDLETALSRIIKFGVPGLPMAGHEYLPDEEIVGLARHVQSLHKKSGAVHPPPSSHEDSDRR
jgi:cbb3-type cytochrome oxidase cytochrome c subunit